MEDTGIFGLNPSSMAIVLIFVVIAVWTAYTWFYGGVTVPLPSYTLGFRGSAQGFRNSVGLGRAQGFRDISGSTQGFEVPEFVKKEKEGFRSKAEGFGGIAHGAGSPSCLRSSAEGAQLIDMFAGKKPRFAEGPDALSELTVLVGKLSCFKKDLVSPSYIVNATRMQPYSTTHDIEPVAETTARCFAKTISPRDLGISLDKWTSRGEALVKKLCTSYALKQGEVETAQKLFREVVRDVSDIARSSCLAGEPSIAGKPGPRDAHPYEKPSAVEYGTYTGYY
jgi:hypothetical protein